MSEQLRTPLRRTWRRLRWIALLVPVAAILLGIAANHQNRRFTRSIDWYVESTREEWRRAERQRPDLFTTLLLWGRFELTNFGMMRTHDSRYTWDAAYRPSEEWEELTQGLPIPWSSYYRHARSRSHALAIRQRLLDQRANLIRLKAVRWNQVAEQFFTIGVLTGLSWIGIMLIGPVRRAYRPVAVTVIRGGMAAKSHVGSLVDEAKGKNTRAAGTDDLNHAQQEDQP